MKTACLYVNPEHRNKGFGEALLRNGLMEAGQKGYKRLYLSTGFNDFYERKGWTYLCNGFNFFDDSFKIYVKSTEIKAGITKNKRKPLQA
ncbi:GNAT family N-acetyltransferase [Parapedobacter deserti]|uniref:GNAT family N-acetyltransferase n=1 Tax=Parapedobacter deserti TaxID=1912957 RepID=A0ABV7JPN9_9SPHI